MVVPSVPALFMLGCPDNIARFVTFVHVDSLNRVRRAWSKSNVCQEQRKIAPSMTYGDASRSVIRVSLVIRIEAPSSQVLPNLVLRNSSPTMFGVPGTKGLSIYAAATFSVTAL